MPIYYRCNSIGCGVHTYSSSSPDHQCPSCRSPGLAVSKVVTYAGEERIVSDHEQELRDVIARRAWDVSAGYKTLLEAQQAVELTRLNAAIRRLHRKQERIKGQVLRECSAQLYQVLGLSVPDSPLKPILFSVSDDWNKGLARPRVLTGM